jgi:hypothetical protein
LGLQQNDVRAYDPAKFRAAGGGVSHGNPTRCQYQIYGHEHLAESAGIARATIATIVAGERPTNLSPQEAVAYDVAAALNRGAPLPETVYQAGVAAFGERGVAEIIYLVACFHMVAIILNGYAVSDPSEDDLAKAVPP